MPPKVSIIVPNYNHARFLTQRLESIFNQTYQDFEVILLDDGSTDNSVEILEKYGKNDKVSALIFNIENSGSTFKQWVKGIDLARGEFIWIAESDDFAEPDFLERLLEQFKNNSDVGLIYSHIRWVDKSGKEISRQNDSGKINYFPGSVFIKRYLLFSTTIFNIGSAIFKKSIYQGVKYNEICKFDQSGDYYLYVLLSEKSDIIEICSILNNYRLHENNKSSLLRFEGVDFIESLSIINYIVEKYRIESNSYSTYYARYWLKKNYSKKVNHYIAKNIYKDNKLIVLLYYLIKIARWIT